MSRTVAEALTDILERIGLSHSFGLIEGSLNPLGDATFNRLHVRIRLR